MKKDILIIGVPKSGKHTIGKMLFKKLGYSYILSEDFLDTLNLLNPTQELSQEAISLSLIDIVKKANSEEFEHILDLNDLSPEFLINNIDLDKNIILCFGYPNANIPEKSAKLRYYNKLNLDDKELLEYTSKCINISKEYKRICENNNLIFVDTSSEDYEYIFNDILSKLDN